MLSFNTLLIFSENPKKLAEFYKKVFNVDPGWADGDWTGFQVGANHIAIGSHSEVKGQNKNPQRLMFNLETTAVREEFTRIKGYGTKVIAEPYQMGGVDGWIATFEDPDGNYFQLVSPMNG